MERRTARLLLITITTQQLLLRPMDASTVLIYPNTPAKQREYGELQVRSWAASCANCHGTQGQALPPMQSLAGTAQEVIVQRMMDFKSGKVPSATVMHQLAKGYSDEQIAAIAAYFAAQKR